MQKPPLDGADPTASLPDHVLQHILTYLAVGTLYRRATRVCKRWNRLAHTRMIKSLFGFEIKWGDYATKQTQPATLPGGENMFACFALHPDGRMYGANKANFLISARGADPTALSTMHGHSNLIRALVLSPDGNRLYSASADHNIKVWDTNTNALLLTLIGHLSAVTSLAIAPDGLALYSGSAGGNVRVWSTGNGAQLRRVSGVDADPKKSRVVGALAVSPDGQHFWAGMQSGIEVFSTADGSRVRILNGHTGHVTALVFCHRSGLVYSSSRDRTIRVWSADDGSYVRRVDAGLRKHVTTLALSNDGQRLFAGDDTLIRVWNTSNGSSPVVKVNTSGRVFSLALSADGSLYSGQ